ncbi:MAG: FAD-dependent monooxygenase [Mariprofundales bacterium]|nr:FAD-dependent monooxygenase [Mariprofundales bacterium]
MVSSCDVVVVGGGAVGSALAIDLLDRGCDLLLLEGSRPEYRVQLPEREIALSAGSIRYLQQLAVWTQLEEEGVGEIHHISVVESGGRARVALDRADSEPLGAVVEMGQLLRAMHPLLGERLHTLAVVSSWELCDGGVKLYYHLDGEERTMITRLLVAADGTSSRLRRLAGIGSVGWDHNRFGLVASVATANGHRNCAYECFHPQGPLALLPMADDRLSLVWAAAPRAASLLMELDDTAFMEQLQGALDNSIMQQIGVVESITPRAVFPLELTIAKSLSAPRVALVGNAAHTVHPVAGQGMNLGLRDAAALAQAVSTAPGGDPGKEIVLAHYADMRRKDMLMTAAFTEGVLTTFATAGRAAKIIRQAGLCAMNRSGWLRHLLIDHATGRAQTPL